ncbi:MAG: M6 family metalloprotease domain-containing protein [Vibrio sp.]
MKFKLSSGILCLSLISAMSHAAIPYQDKTYQYTQPNGEVITLHIDGNDYYAEQRTNSGRLVIYDDKLKGMAYAKVSQDGAELLSTGELATATPSAKQNAITASKVAKHYKKQQGLSRAMRAKLAEQAHEQRLHPTSRKHADLLSSKLLATNSDQHVTGKIRGLTVMIQFPDEAGTMSRAQINNYLNADNYTEFGNKQSIRGYYQSVSNNKVDYTNTVVGYYTAKHNKAYYTNESLEFSLRARELITEALQWLEYQQGFDFSTLSTNSRGEIRGLNFFYAGSSGNSWSKGLWPHMGWLSPQFCADGVCTSKYQITDMSDSLSIGTFAHESGHLLFDWPDLYDYDGSSDGSVASYGIMGYGGVGYRSMYQPTPPVSPLRDLVGWETVTELNPKVDPNAPTGRLSLTNMSHQEYKWTNPASAGGEAFYLEAINQQGQNREQLGSGLAIYHIDNNGDRDNEWHPYIQMEHADGRRDPENGVNRGDADDVYHQYGEFTATLPNALRNGGTNSLWWDGSESGLTITDVSQPGQTISFLSSASNDDSGTPGDGSGDNSGGGNGDNGENPDTGALVYAGNIEPYSYVIEPNGSYFQVPQDQTLNISLTGAANTDFGIGLYQLINNQWQPVAASQTEGTSSESIRYNAPAGYYYVLIAAYQGSGQYKLTISQ